MSLHIYTGYFKLPAILKNDRLVSNLWNKLFDAPSSSTNDADKIHLHLKPMERKINLTIRDRMELRNDLTDRIENIVLTIIEKLMANKLVEIEYKMTNIDTLMEQIESNGAYPNENDESNESVSTLDDGSLDYLETPESGFSESFDRETIDKSRDSKKCRVTPASERGVKRFALIVTAMAKIHQLLLNNETQSRRTFFYELKNGEATRKMISNQRQIDRIVNIVANILDCAPWEMGLVASSKGLCSGDLILTLENDEEIDYGVFGGCLISPRVSDAISLQTRAAFVLVVEKDTVFHKLLQENCPRALNCIMITGKGYPDVATRILVKTLAEKLRLPVYVLTDADPHGVEIMFTYKYGSISLSHDQASLACPTARWMGLRPSDFERLNIPTVPLTDNDLAKLNAVQSRPFVTDFVSEELQIIRRCGKAGIEALTFALGSRELTSSYVRTHLQEEPFFALF